MLLWKIIFLKQINNKIAVVVTIVKKMKIEEQLKNPVTIEFRIVVFAISILNMNNFLRAFGTRNIER